MPLVRELPYSTPIDRRYRPSLRILALFVAGATQLGPYQVTGLAALPGPVLLQNCGVATRVASPPARVVTLNQAATEVMLVLGLRNHIVGTSYLDDQIL